MFILPIVNGVLPQPHGGHVQGVFSANEGAEALAATGIGKELLLCLYIMRDRLLFPVGVICRIVDFAQESVISETGEESVVLLVALEGREHARWHTLKRIGASICTPDCEVLNFQLMRKEYPVISGAGWAPLGGYTEFRSDDDIPVTIYGSDLQTGQEISITANLGGLVSQEHAHTIEHAIIRSLSTYGLCTARTLAESVVQEADELKQSLDYSLRTGSPETLGWTSKGACGNRMTQMAQKYLVKDLAVNLSAGISLRESLSKARQSTMSQLTQDLGLTMQNGVRVLQSLKKGMSHDDTPLKMEVYKKIIRKFPLHPWE